MTSPFKRMVARDNSRVFINMMEFAAEHNIDGRMVPCVLDTDLYKERQSAVSQRIEGVFVDTVSLFVELRNLAARPKVGMTMRVDRQLYVVAEVSEAMGMLEITLEANRQ